MTASRRPFGSALLALLAACHPPSGAAEDPKPAAAMVDPANDLLVGPLDVVVETADDGGVVRKTVQLQFLTRRLLTYREYETPGRKETLTHPVVKADGASRVRAVRCAEPKGEWAWDEKRREFVGPAIPPPAVRVLRAKDDPEKVRLLLLLKAEKVHLAVGNALAAGDGKRTAEWVAHADTLKAAAEKAKLPAAVAELFDLAAHAEAQGKRNDESARVWKDLRRELEKAKVEVAQELEAVQARYQAEAQYAGTRQLVGNVAFFRSDDTGTRRVGLDLMLAGGDELVAAGLRRSREEARLQGWEGLYEEKAVAAAREIRKAYGAAEAALAERLAAQWKLAGIDGARLRTLESLADSAARDPAAAVELLDARLKYLDGVGVFDPTAFCTRVRIRARLLCLHAASEEDRRKRVEELMGMADAAVAATGKVPGAPEFDSDRVALLGAAGDLIHLAVNYSHAGAKSAGPKRWSDFHDPRADRGVRVLDEALAHTGDAGDRDGHLRATRAWLLSQRGLREMALTEGQKVETLRETDAVTQYNLARVYAQNGNPKEAVRRFELAIKHGFRDLAAAAADGDLALLKTQKFWAEYSVKPRLSVTSYPTKGGGAEYTLEIRNTGELPLVNAKLFYTTDPSNRQPPLARQAIDYLAPGDTYYWVNAYKGQPADPFPRLGKREPVAGLVVELPHLLTPPGRVGVSPAKPLAFDVKPGGHTRYFPRY